MKPHDDGVRFRLSLLDIVTLLYNVYRGAQTPDVGYEDCDRTLKEMIRDFGGRTTRAQIPRETLESAMWSCNQMDVIGKFWSPTNEKFSDLVRRIEQSAVDGAAIKFDHRYNLLREKGKN